MSAEPMIVIGEVNADRKFAWPLVARACAATCDCRLLSH